MSQFYNFFSNSDLPIGEIFISSPFQLLEENIITFVKNELKGFKKLLNSKWLEKNKEEEAMIDNEEKEHRRSSREAFLKISLNFLRRMKQDKLADSLQSSKRLCICLVQERNYHYISKASLCMTACCSKVGSGF